MELFADILLTGGSAAVSPHQAQVEAASGTAGLQSQRPPAASPAARPAAREREVQEEQHFEVRI